jgi:hypothetical protein
MTIEFGINVAIALKVGRRHAEGADIRVRIAIQKRSRDLISWKEPDFDPV